MTFLSVQSQDKRVINIPLSVHLAKHIEAHLTNKDMDEVIASLKLGTSKIPVIEMEKNNAYQKGLHN